MLTLRYLNGFDRENNNMDAVAARFGTYVPTTGIAHAFTQAQSTPGYQGGRGWFLFNTAFWETNYHVLLGASFNSVVFHAHFKPSGGYTQVLFLRFESGANAPGICLRIRTDGKLDVMTGGQGRNASPGVGLATTTNTLPLDTWTEVEVRIDCSTGRVSVWIGNSLDVDLTGVSAGASIDRVTWRWEAFGFRGIACDHLAIATDDTVSADRIGVAVINTLKPEADYQTSPLWVPNSGTTHFSRLAENTGALPDQDSSYLSNSAGSGDDLYTFETPECFGRILGLALNIDRKLVSGAPSVTPLLLHPDGAGVQTFGTPSALTSAYKYDQFLHQLDPVTADYWSDPTIVASAFGMRGGGSGVSRVTYMHIEKLVSLLDVPYECGEGGSYII